jgi:serine/threonine-protein kinase
MPLNPGTRLGPYEILGLVGSGGMGEVYRGRDTRLDRVVAIKVSSLRLGGAALRERFERESRAISSLNHPHICALYDVGSEGDFDFLVMEYVEGETLAARLTRGALPLDAAIATALEIADALVCAHAAGIVHRDLKPANIMLTRGGVKLLDFGIAKLTTAPAEADLSTRTGSGVLTGEGMVLGTLRHMAPEQLEGRQVDPRTDIFAFGTVVYEMVSGRCPFDGPTGAATIAAILSTSPPLLATVEPRTPPALSRLVEACLVKDPGERWQSSHDLRRELRWLSGPREADVRPGRQATSSRSRWLAIAAGAFVAGSLLGAASTWSRSTAPPASLVARLAILPEPGEALISATRNNQGGGAGLDVSPDGSKLVYVIASESGVQRLVFRSIARFEATPIPNTENASTPFFSPDGEWIGFIADGRLKKIPVNGGAALTICNVPPVTRGASWSPDGTIYISPTFSDGLFKVSSGGGKMEEVTSLTTGESNHLLPHVLPGGRAVVFTVWNGGSFDDASVWLWSADTGQRRKLIDAASGGRYSATGHLIFARGGALLAVTFDLTRLEVSGTPIPVVDSVLMNPANGTAEFAVSGTGTLVYGMVPPQPAKSTMVWVDRLGKEEQIAEIPADLMRPRLSPDGLQVAIENLNDIWVYEFGTGGLRRVTFRGVNQYPVWARDGKRIVFSRAPAGKGPALFSAESDGSREAHQITSGDFVDFPNDFSPDGALAFTRIRGVNNDGNWQILAHTDAGGEPNAVVSGTFSQVTPTFSPDGKWLAYSSTQTGRPEIYVQAYPVAARRVQISSEGGTQPRWGRDGREVFYYNGVSLMRAAVTTRPELRASRPAKLFEGRYLYDLGVPGYPGFDVSLDGRRFLMIKGHAAATPARLTVVLNWFEELRSKVKRD